ncbi:MAG: DnaJ domain-containing protein [Deltaproteobacteria bacterium]|nr:DnaJ domain-containing protein [Deltaproteobacteria bacterium]
MARLDPKFVGQVIALAKVIDKFDYYKILQVQRQASLGQIRKAYHKQSRIFHPDRYFHLDDKAFKDSIFRISKRVTEAYVTLRDAQKRSFYDKQLEETQGQKLRYTEESDQAQKQSKKEEIGKTDQGRRMYRQGMQLLDRKDFRGAERAFKMAAAYEPDNELFKQKAEEAGAQIKTDYAIK